mmetsp:Transcript_22625/g.40725  ORF Transcript_22625/g.40725 Transcript_22625/m.40725 type:complete len:140 (-) Transcript_22625:45-464(-)
MTSSNFKERFKDKLTSFSRNGTFEVDMARAINKPPVPTLPTSSSQPIQFSTGNFSTSRALASPGSVSSAPNAEPAFIFARRISAADISSGSAMQMTRPMPMSAAPREVGPGSSREPIPLKKKGQATLSVAEIKCEYVEV